MLSFNTFNFALVLAAACNDVSFALPSIRGLTLDGDNVDAPVNVNHIDLGSAIDYVILTETGIDSAIPYLSVINGDIAVSPIVATAITGFSLIADSPFKSSWSAQLCSTCKAFASDYVAAPPPFTSTLLTTAVLDMQAAYETAKNLTCESPGCFINYENGALPRLVGDTAVKLAGGVYSFNGDVTIGGSITFTGDENTHFVMQIEGNLEQVGGTQVILEGGVLAQNIVWQVGGYVRVKAGPLGTPTSMKGILLVKNDVTIETLSTLNGRILAQKHCALQKATITPA
jgi:hypothetical protein